MAHACAQSRTPSAVLPGALKPGGDPNSLPSLRLTRMSQPQIDWHADDGRWATKEERWLVSRRKMLDHPRRALFMPTTPAPRAPIHKSCVSPGV